MARTYGNIITAIWLDPDFRSLTAAAQHTYLMLVTQPDITSVGILPMTLRRWSNYAADTTVEGLSSALRYLSDRRFVVIDEDSEELLVRSFVRWDGGYKNPKRLMAIKSAAIAVNGGLLRGVLAGELDRLSITHQIEVTPIEGPSDAHRTPIDPPRVVVTEVGSTHKPQTTTTTRTPHSGNRDVKRGTRIPADWQPSLQLIEWVKTECPAVDGRTETAKFVDHFIAKAGKDGVKLDWDAAFRNWIRGAIERMPNSSFQQRAPTPATSGGQSTGTQRAMASVNAARQIAEARSQQTQIGASS